MKKIFAVLLALAMVLGMVPALAEGSAWDGAYMGEEDFKAYIKYDLEKMVATILPQLTEEETAAVTEAKEAGDAAIDAAANVAEVGAAYDAAVAAIMEAVPVADGLFSYKKESNEERTNILGILEQFAVTTGITGISLFENGNYVMYNPRVTLGTENYIVGLASASSPRATSQPILSTSPIPPGPVTITPPRSAIPAP